MGRQLYVANSIHGRSFSSASDICGLNRWRPGAPAVSQLGGRRPVGGYSTKSLSSMGGSRRISCSGSYWMGGRKYGDIYYGSPRNYIESPNYTRSYWNDHIHGVSVNKNFLKPLSVGIDIQKIRIQEREQMKSLNTQFAGFIDKVRNLEQRNKVLVTKWELLQEQVPPVKRDLQPLFENSIGGLCKQLDILLREKGQMRLQLQNIQQCMEEFKCKYEEVINRRATAENNFVLLKKDVDCAFMNKKELEVQAAALKRETEFLRGIYDEELSLLNQQIQCETSVVMEMDNSRGLDMTCILQNVDSWYQSIVCESKEEVNALYRSRFQELQNRRHQINDDLKKNKREVAELNQITQRRLCDLDKVTKQATSLQSAVFDAERRGDLTLKDAQEKLDELHGTLHKSKDELAGMLRNYQELLNDKLALDIEIATYKSLLEGEENRLISGNLVSIAVVPLPTPSIVADGSRSEPGYGFLGGDFSSRNGKCNRGGPGMGQAHRNVDCYPVGYASRTMSKQSIPGGEECSKTGENDSTSSSNASGRSQRPRGTSDGTVGYPTSVAARRQGGHTSTGKVAGAYCHHGRSTVALHSSQATGCISNSE